jgi:hypothetical protein
MWETNPDRLVGVVIGDDMNVLDIDIDPEKGTDGYFTLDTYGLTYPDSYEILTPSGGKHVYFRNTSGNKLGPLAPVKLSDGTKLEGIDRRAGSSYAIAYSDTAPTLKELAAAPEWLCIPSSDSGHAPYSGKLEDWFNNLPQGAPDIRVARAISTFPSGEFGHQEMITKQTHLVRLGSEGCVGVPEALAELLERTSQSFNSIGMQHLKAQCASSAEPLQQTQSQRQLKNQSKSLFRHKQIDFTSIKKLLRLPKIESQRRGSLGL